MRDNELLGMAAGEATLESWLNRATDPSNQEEKWEFIKGFYEQVNKELEGPQIATRLLAHKIQSPQEMEALQALTILETCMNNCGKRFHSEAGKFRFLNELIKVLSPKYLGTWTTEKVKSRLEQTLYSWTVWLPEDVKVKEAYHMLKKQGIIKKDPKLPENTLWPPPCPRTRSSVFDEEDKSKLLARLLKSSHPDDLQAANRLIKNTVKEDQEKMEKVSKRINAIEEVQNNTKLLNEMLTNYRRGDISDSDRDVMKGLYDRCEKLRPTLFRLAGDTVDNDEALAEILQANDKLTLAVHLYQELVERRDVNGNNGSNHSKTKAPQNPGTVKSYHLIDLSELESESSPSAGSRESPQRRAGSPPTSLLDEELMLLGLDSPSFPPISGMYNLALDQPVSQGGFSGSKNPEGLRAAVSSSSSSGQGSAQDHVELRDSSQWPLTPQAQQNKSGPVLQPRSALGDLQNHPITSSARHPKPLSPAQREPTDSSLSDVFVSLDSIKLAGGILPVTAYDKNGFRVTLHFARDPPAGRADVLVTVLSMFSTSPLPIRNIVFQAAVPKAVRIKLQTATSSELPAFNPILPPAVISQVMLLTNPQKEKVRLRFKLSFTQGGQSFCELGEVEHFPEISSWTGH
ncbi:ADP-ribosylation factor-binding protein GGA1-like isoform X1 [Acipenser oxyrinchus oxyrinchus]|uniref:ADP-ribosylation factor-binding protein GGA1-like isoform X1 n=1 Tax=Acipenser oxyrinchus oxyrinchus TaxID=40147 RepID=A0AAD8DBQ2_ACIOX|nr:ADP-ribosylation factor-binding protein GGA1-like isoform X1 [Acipenser oxyrinchus oxyrinchus]